MTTLLEDPLPVLFAGVVTEAILVSLFLSTRKKLWLIPIFGILLLVIALVLVERFVVTEREEVEHTVDAVAAALVANDVEAVLAHLSDSARESRKRASWSMDRIEISAAKVSGLEITVNSRSNPPTARADFFGAVKFEDRKQEYPYSMYSANFEVDFCKEGGRWKVVGHRELPSTGQ